MMVTASSSSSSSLFSILPASIICDCVVPFLNSSDILTLRAICRRSHDILHNEQDSEDFWERRLKSDFDLDHLEVLRIEESFTNSTTLSPRWRERAPCSIFGVNLVDATTIAPTAFHAWISWHKAKRRYYYYLLERQQENDFVEDGNHQLLWFRADYFLRAAHIWQRIAKWCVSDSSGSVGHRILKSLDEEGVPGKHSTDWPEEFRFNKNLHACHALFAFCGGQESSVGGGGNIFDIICSAFDGLMGAYYGCGYYSCAHLVCVPVKEDDTAIVVEYNDDNNNNSGGGAAVIVARCYMSESLGFQRLLYVDACTGHVLFQQQTGGPLRAVANAPIFSNDDVLTWLEEHTRRLQTNEITVENLRGLQGSSRCSSENHEVLALFPRFPNGVPPCSSGGVTEGVQPISRAVTNGIEIIASAVYVPQGRNLFNFILSLRIRLLGPDDQGYVSPSERGFDSCQLHSHTWQITDSTRHIVKIVDGWGVAGIHPILHENGYEDCGVKYPGIFQHPSCVGGINDGSFHGHITFIPGTLAVPTGQPFQAEVRPFELNSRPDFLF